MRDHRAFSITLAAMCGLAGCGQGEEVAAPVPVPDPLLVQALNDQLMVDPDLSLQNEGNAALTVSFDHTLPSIDTSPDAVATIRDEMRMALLEGGDVLDLPPAANRGKSRPEKVLELAPACAEPAQAERSAIWAARLPDYAAIPPRGAVTGGWGRDETNCHSREVTYLTPVAADEAMQFHYTLASRAGLKPRIFSFSNGDRLLQAKTDAKQLTIAATPLPSGLVSVAVTSVELAT